jgi:regulatory protein
MNRMKKQQVKDETQLFQYGIRLLGMREWSRHGMEQKMKAYSDVKSDIENALFKMEEYGYLDDRRFTEIYVRSCKESRGYGPVKIRYKLKEKGIAETLIAEYVDPHSHEWHLKAFEARQRKFEELPDSAEEKGKQMNFLVRRGFSFDQIKSAFKTRDNFE